ncbi:hypothetical protein B0T11DRAFT_285553 [Plectosphaerella cucumerina]|uniref:Uncharacterized protein n=1 Tax=Plectosphaerella cucumerina TaxID=40658 RepID=A0A8K0X3P5_9PEZI|nr:hypothetical protein B0T11DRAFT_285553 [Plectosphaerella cucumerina]
MDFPIGWDEQAIPPAELRRLCAAAQFAQFLNETIPPFIEEETIEKRSMEEEAKLEEPERKKLKLNKDEEEEEAEVDWRSLPFHSPPLPVQPPVPDHPLSRVSADFLDSLIQDKTRLGLAEPRIHREKLLGLLNQARFTDREKFMFFTLFCTYGTSERVLAVFDNIEHYRRHPSAEKIKAFIRDKSVPEITLLDRNTFAPALVGVADPSADFYSWAHSAPNEQLTIDNMLDRVTACQLKLDERLQIQARANFYSRFAVGEFNAYMASYVRTRDNYYARLGAEQFFLLDRRKQPLNTGRPYVREDIED